jgi:hypothetical protein
VLVHVGRCPSGWQLSCQGTRWWWMTGEGGGHEGGGGRGGDGGARREGGLGGRGGEGEARWVAMGKVRAARRLVSMLMLCSDTSGDSPEVYHLGGQASK